MSAGRKNSQAMYSFGEIVDTEEFSRMDPLEFVGKEFVVLYQGIFIKAIVESHER